MFLLDVLQFGMQPLQNIQKLLANTTGVGWRLFWSHDFTDAEVIRTLRSLIESGDVVLWTFDQAGDLKRKDLNELDSPIEDAWFERTDAGRKRVEAWEPPVLPPDY
jgi:hypothetical protein